MGTLYEVNQATGGIGAPVLGESASNGVYSTLAHNNVKNQARLQYDSKTEGMQGIAFVYDNGEITLTGTATAQAYTFPAMSASGFDLEPDRHYIMTGIPSNAPEGVTLRLRYNDGGNKIIATDEGNGAEVEFTKAQREASGGFHLMINVKSGTVIPEGGIVIKPMIRYVEDVDPTFEKHVLNNKELGEQFENHIKKEEYTTGISSDWKVPNTSDIVFKFVKHGKHVQVFMVSGGLRMHVAGSTAGNVKVGDIPAACIPKSGQFFVIRNINDWTSNILVYYLPNGNIEFYGYGPADTAMNCYGCFGDYYID